MDSLDDVIWLTKQAKFTGISASIGRCLAEPARPFAVLLVAHFRDCLEQLQAIVEQGGFDQQSVIVATAEVMKGRSTPKLGADDSQSYFIVSVGTALITGVLLVVRCFRVRICVATVDQAAAHRMQFTIRQLLVLTFAVACLVSLGKWLAPHVMNVTDRLILTLIGLVLATVGLLSVWPALGARHPVLPSVILIVVAGGIGFCFYQFLPPMSGMARFWMTITSVEALSLVPSLLVVRSCGYRLVRLPPGHPTER